MELEEIVKKVKAKDLKEAAKKREIKLGRCPTKMDIAKLLPIEVVEELATNKK